MNKIADMHEEIFGFLNEIGILTFKCAIIQINEKNTAKFHKTYCLKGRA